MIVFLILLVMGCVSIGILRFVIGPSDADRIVAVDILFSGAIVLCVFAALVTDRVLFLDVAIGVVLIGFVAVLAWARLIETRGRKDTEFRS